MAALILRAGVGHPSILSRCPEQTISSAPQANSGASPGHARGLEGQPLQLFSAEPLVPQGEQPALGTPVQQASRSQRSILGHHVLPPALEPLGAPWPSALSWVGEGFHEKVWLTVPKRQRHSTHSLEVQALESERSPTWAAFPQPRPLLLPLRGSGLGDGLQELPLLLEAALGLGVEQQRMPGPCCPSSVWRGASQQLRGLSGHSDSLASPGSKLTYSLRPRESPRLRVGTSRSSRGATCTPSSRS